MLEIFKDENINDLLECFLYAPQDSQNSGKSRYLNIGMIYSKLVGADERKKVSEIDKKKQTNFVDFASRTFDFIEGYSPADGYMTQYDNYCRAYSADSKLNNIKHRLYFNFGDERINFVDLLIRQLKFNELPFAIKWDKNYLKKDNVVMYIEDDKLEQTAEVIKNIVTKYPQFTTPKDLPVSVVNGGWFGYGVENVDEDDRSYNGRMTECLTRSFIRAFNQFRGEFEISSVTEFAQFLFEQCKQQKIMHGASYQELHEDGKYLKPIFNEQALRLALDLLGSARENTGFGVTPDGKDAITDDLAIKTITDHNTGKSIYITPSSVMNTLIRMMDQGKCFLDLTQEKKNELIKTVKENLKEELIRKHIPTELPEVLKPLALSNLQNLKSTEENVM